MLYTHFAAALVGAALAGTMAWQVQNWRADSHEKERIEAQQEATRINEKAASTASTGFETKRANNETRYRTVTVEVQKIVDRPVYLQQCLDDDGLRIINRQIRREADPGEPGLKLPGSGAAGRNDGKRSGAVGGADGAAVPGLPGQS